MDKTVEFLLRKYLSKIPGCVHFGLMHVSDGIPKRASRPSCRAFPASSPAEKHTRTAAHAAMEHCYAGRAAAPRASLTTSHREPASEPARRSWLGSR
jgi:hypothetical protein